MENAFYNTLIKRRVDLLNELKHIEELIKIYQVATSSPETNDDSINKMRRTKFKKRRHNVKSQVVTILKSLGEEFYVSELVKAMQDKEPNKDHKLISNKARNYIHILKKEGVISSRLVENNKYVYKVINK